MSDHSELVERLLGFWFGPLDADGNATRERSERWYKKEPEFDAHLRELFGRELERAGRGELNDLAETPRGRLALIILFDQFARNIHRGSPRAFENDTRAVSLVLEGLALGHDRELALAERQFFYMPLMHSENLEHQNRCIAEFQRATKEHGGKLDFALPYAERHRDIIARFGRFPHRNAVLGRQSTKEEIEFLKEPGSSF